MMKITERKLRKIFSSICMLFSMILFAQEQIAVIQEPFVVLLDATDGSVVDPTFIDLSPLSQGTPKDLLQVNDELWISDQIEDRIDRFDLDGNFLSSINTGLDNIKGMELVNNSEVWVTNAGSNNGAPGVAVVRFDLNGGNLGFFSTVPDSSFDIIDTGTEVYISYIGAGTRIERRDYSGNVLGNIVGTGIVTFLQQMEINTTNNSVYAAVFSTTGSNGAGLYEFSIANGAILNSWEEGSLRGVAQLDNGNLLVSAGAGYGVKILDPNTGTTTPLWTEASQYFGRVNLTPCSTPPTPTGDATQTFDEGATIEDIVVDPVDVTWFATEADALAGTNPLPAGTLLVDGATYYAVNIVGGCLSAPFAVTVTILCTPPPPPTGDSNQSFVDGATIEDIVVDPTDVSWFPTENDATNSTNELPPGTLLVDGQTYWAVNIVNDCKSTPFPVTVSVCTIPAAPTGDTEQTLPQGAVIEDIVVNPTDVTWFATEDDAINNTNPLPAGTVLVDGATYWAASINGICVSDPLGVTITLLLGISEFQQQGIYVYPNPIHGVLTLHSTKLSLEKVTIYTLLGSKLMEIEVNQQEFTIDLSNLSSGVYILVAESGAQRFSTQLIKR